MMWCVRCLRDTITCRRARVRPLRLPPLDGLATTHLFWNGDYLWSCGWAAERKDQKDPEQHRPSGTRRGLPTVSVQGCCSTTHSRPASPAVHCDEGVIDRPSRTAPSPVLACDWLRNVLRSNTRALPLCKV